MASFEDLLTLPALHNFVREAGFARPTAVQTAAIPKLLAGSSVSVLAQTGSGKTLAYALPVVELLKRLEADVPVAERSRGAPRAWILYPTRELGAQIAKVFKAIAHHSKLCVRHVGGGDSQKRRRTDVRGPVDVIITTPSLAKKALASGELRANAARIIIFDEADQLLDPSFITDVKAVVGWLTCANPQVGLFSATKPPTFQALRTETFPYSRFDEITLQGSHTLKNNIATENYSVPFKDKPEQAARLLRKTAGRGFVFVNQKVTAQELFSRLQQTLASKRIDLLHGGLEPQERRRVLDRFANEGDILVCTDIAARGLDVPGLDWVLNYDLPFEAGYYVHRCGRVGREGQAAQVYNFVTTKDRGLIARINTAIANQSSLKLSRVAEVKSAGERRASSSTRHAAHEMKRAAAGGGRGKVMRPRPASGRAGKPAPTRAKGKAYASKSTGGKRGHNSAGRVRRGGR